MIEPQLISMLGDTGNLRPVRGLSITRVKYSYIRGSKSLVGIGRTIPNEQKIFCYRGNIIRAGCESFLLPPIVELHFARLSANYNTELIS